MATIAAAKRQREKTQSAKTTAPRKGLAGLARLESSSRTGQVVEQLTRLILDGELKEAELLPPERELAERLGVSRNVVREASKILQSRGLLTIRHGVGTVVNGAGSEPVQQAFHHALHGQANSLLQLTEFRLLAEVEIASLAAQRARPHDLEQLKALIEQMEASLDDPARYVDLDIAFHAALAVATQNNIFALVLDATVALSREARLRSLEAGTTLHQSQQMHRAIYEAVAARNPALAARRMRGHLKALETDIKRKG